MCKKIKDDLVIKHPDTLKICKSKNCTNGVKILEMKMTQLQRQKKKQIWSWNNKKERRLWNTKAKDRRKMIMEQEKRLCNKGKSKKKDE